jgi:hypothetical protein
MVQGTGILTLPTKCQMVGSSFTIYSRIAYKSLINTNVSSIIKIPTVDFVSSFNFSENMYNVISKKLIDNSNHLRYVSNRFQDLKTASIRLNMLDDIMKQYEPNNFIPELRHYVSATILLTLIVVGWYFQVDKLCRTKKKFTLLPVTFKKNKVTTDVTDEDLMIDKLENIPLEDRIKMNRRK